MQSEQIEVLEKALAKYKAEKQLLVCIEELSELIKAITKVKRYPDEAGRLSNVIEEVADVSICAGNCAPCFKALVVQGDTLASSYHPNFTDASHIFITPAKKGLLL